MRAPAGLAALLLLFGPVLGSASPAAPADAAWEAKADAPLRAAVASGDAWVSVAVQGAPIAPPHEAPASRAAWRAHWTEQAQPFLAWLDRAAAGLGAAVTSTTPAIGAAHVRLPSHQVPALLGHAEVRRAGLDWLGATHPSADLADTVAKVQAPDLWSLGYRGEGVKLAIIDTGVRPTHEMLRAADGITRVAEWFDATGPGGACADPCDVDGHGTHVASTAAGSNLFNPSSPQGVAPRATLLGVRIFQGSSGTWEDAQDGLQAAFDMGAEVTSNSWGGDCDNDGVMTGELAETLANAGMLSVFAAGNSGASGVDCPGVADKVTTVGSVDLNEVIAGSSGRGPCTWASVSRTCPDVVAVGVGVVAAGHGCDTCYVSKSGTSMATPHVAGVVALLQQARKAQLGMGLSAPDKEADVLLHVTAKDLGSAGADNAYGWGLAQGKAAYDRMVSGPALQLVHEFHIALPEMRARQANELGFTLTNLGSVTVQGRMVHRAVQQDTGACPPACEAVTITDADVTLGRFAERTSSLVFRGADHAAGTWRVTGSFAYTYTNPVDGLVKSGLVEASGSFVLRKVAWAVGRALPATTTTGTLLLSGLTLANVGNDDARQVVLEESFDAKGHLPAPIAPPGPGLLGFFADPPPDHLSHAQPTTLLYFWDDVGTVAQGTSWHTRYNFLAAHPGTFVFHAVLAYEDGAGDTYEQAFDQVSSVTLL